MLLFAFIMSSVPVRFIAEIHHELVRISIYIYIYILIFQQCTFILNWIFFVYFCRHNTIIIVLRCQIRTFSHSQCLSLCSLSCTQFGDLCRRGKKNNCMYVSCARAIWHKVTVRICSHCFGCGTD